MSLGYRWFFGGDAPQQPDPDTLFVPAFANSTALVTSGGLVLVDSCRPAEEAAL